MIPSFAHCSVRLFLSVRSGAVLTMTNKVDLAYAMQLAPADAIAYFESKGYATGFNWYDVQAQANAKAFTVAGVLRLDILADIQNGLKPALSDGDTERDIERKLLPLLEQKGWIGKGLVADPETGELWGKRLTPRRIGTIFSTSIQSAYAAGRWKQQVANKTERPYWQRVAVMDLHTRPRHALLNGFTAAADSPVWDCFYPPDGYGCRCRIRAFTRAQVEARGFAVHEPALYDIEQEYGIPGKTRTVKAMKIGSEVYTADPGFGFNPGKVAFTPTLDKYATQAARQYITGSLTGPDFARGLASALAGNASPQQTYPVAMLPGEPGTLRTVSVVQTAMPEMSGDVADFVAAQQTIESPTHTVTHDGMTWYARQADNVWQVAGVRDRLLSVLKQGDNLDSLLPEGVNVPDNH
ncbi:minor capsid protein [Salmonella enterica]|nr:phage head morphogenesis protein [Salmonella enterica]EDB7603432.1 phage head morphogenesis protein [Salmonella enterica]EDC2514557.1 phage head morphogenesis protein [Salmonella enterica]EDZ4045807.1 phage head morphogenesis protein [Salmonella enterica]EEF3986145.1 phage head morphogenesis protein [Salmonella enterica]